MVLICIGPDMPGGTTSVRTLSDQDDSSGTVSFIAGAWIIMKGVDLSLFVSCLFSFTGDNSCQGYTNWTIDREKNGD